MITRLYQQPYNEFNLRGGYSGIAEVEIEKPEPFWLQIGYISNSQDESSL